MAGWDLLGGLISSRLRICIANASVGLCVALLAILLGLLLFFFGPQIIKIAASLSLSLSLSVFYLSFFPTLVLGSLAYLLVFIYLLLLLLLLLDWLVIMCLLGID